VIPVPAAGTYALRVLGQSFLLEIGSGGLWVQFDLKSA
jgi:hypothetical protein